MKKTILSMCVLGVMVLGLTAGQIFAISGPVIVAKVPFAFTVQGKNLPAGEYTIERVWSSDSYVYLIRNNQDRHSETLFSSEAAQTVFPPKQTELVFDKIGNHYFLREMWTVEDNIGREVPEAKAEKKMLHAGLTLTKELVLARG